MTPFRHPPEIEPLSDLGWRRVEKGVLAQLELASAPAPARSRRRRWPWAAGLGLAACAAVALLLSLDLDPGGGALDPLRTSRIETADAPSHVSLGDAELVVEPGSAIVVAEQADQIEVVLERGTVDCRVAPRQQRAPFVVLAGRVRVEVVGTKFAVSRDGDSARVVVHEGVVEVLAGGDRTRVRAGERWPEREVAAAESPTLEMEAELVERPEQRRPRRPQRATRADAEEPEADAPTPQELYDTAARLESSDPAAAVALYRQLASRNGPWAANALFAHGRLELDRGHHDTGRRLLRRYLRRFPDGANAPDARALLADQD